MKIGIVTFHWAYNYGAVLQAYGLQEYLKGLGHEVYVLDYRPAYPCRQYKVFSFMWRPEIPFGENIRIGARCLAAIPVRWRRHLKFRKFMRKRINLSPVESFLSGRTRFDAIITGSDQIWNPDITGGFDSLYFGQDAVGKAEKIIAYAASAGSVGEIENYPGKMTDDLLCAYTSVSVREKALADFIFRQTGVQVHTAVDPVLLAGEDAFASIAYGKTPAPGRYLLVFQLKYSNYSLAVAKMAEKIARRLNMQVVNMVPMSNKYGGQDLLTAASPERFISMIQNAGYVVTTSYHGTVLSILFRKDFITVKTDEAQSERMKDLLSQLDLTDRMITDESQIVYKRIDYGIVTDSLARIQYESGCFLKDALS